MNIIKSFRVRTARGKSLAFLCFIEFGYVCGIMSKLLSDRVNYVFIFYVLNLVMVGVDLILYFRNRRLDRLAAPHHGL
ncbi:MAG: hypothetical protein LBP27_06510 [Treponema sp.]|jgi:hypothetical protein|nr:hypothetical protein [Treponema sp.]